MASRLPRIPRLALFSGPTCSLCETAKSELAKVRQTRPFQLETINIHEEGQERWKRKYVHWIPALHLEGKEIAKGRWDAQTVFQALADWDKKNEAADQEQQDIQKTEYESYGIYTRADIDHILGERESNDEASGEEWKAVSRCFNCGHEEHSVKECPFRLNRDLIDLSRQYYQFSKGTLGTTNWERVHTAEGWRQTRLNWLDEYEPGVVRGTLLREALGDNGEDEWLRNMAVWGYPKGWVGERDPREAVRERIWAEHGGGIDADLDDSEPFVIYGDEESEVINFEDGFVQVTRHDRTEDESEGEGDPTSPSESLSVPPPSPSLRSDTAKDRTPSTKRWARYPSSHFLSDLLPVYTGFTLPPVDGAQDNAYPPSYSRRPPPPSKFDWDVWAASHIEPEPPPPPPDEPPPLPPCSEACVPPPPDDSPPVPPPPPGSTEPSDSQCSPPSALDVFNKPSDDSDMEMSDCE